MKTTSRIEAELQGLKHYFTGEPCKHDHIASRLVSTGACCKCTAVRREKNKEKNAAYAKEYQLKNREILSEKGRAYRAENRERIAARVKVHRSANKERISAYQKLYRERKNANNQQD